MSKKIKVTGIRWLTAAVILLAAAFQSFAASGRIAFSDPSAKVGEEVSVTMKFSTLDGSALGNTDVMLAYDAASLEYINETENANGGAGAIRVWSAPTGSSEAATILRFKALKSGVTKITVTSWEAYDNNGQTMNVEREGTSTITIAALETSSSDVRLQSLQVSPGTLTPSFSPDVTSYAVTVGLGTQDLAVSAVQNNEKAAVSIEGNTGLQEGENTVVCRVTAEDGTTTGEYRIVVTKTEGGDQISGGSGTAAEPEVLAQLDVTAKKIRIINLPEGVEAPQGLKESDIKIGEVTVKGWTLASGASQEYCVFYGMNEKGEQNFYRFDIAEKTVQRYFEAQSVSAHTDEEFEEVAEKYNSLVDDYRLSRILAIVFAVIALIILILLIIVWLKKSAGRDDGFDSRRWEPQNQKNPKTISSRSAGKKMTQEERYMAGEDDEYEEEDFIGADEDFGSSAPGAEQTAAAGFSGKQPVRKPPAAPKTLDETAASDSEDDFEFFDL